jgi:septum formation protein
MMIYLASSSPRRADLLRQIGIEFQVLAVNVDESKTATESAERYVSRMSETKAQAGRSMLSADAPVLAADTIITIDGNIVGKPSDHFCCQQILAKLSGRKHQVLSAVALHFEGKTRLKFSKNQVTFRALEATEIEAYCASNEPLDKAGAYAIQGKAAIFIDHLEGSYSSVMGLPLFETADLLKQVGITVLKS